MIERRRRRGRPKTVGVELKDRTLILRVTNTVRGMIDEICYREGIGITGLITKLVCNYYSNMIADDDDSYDYEDYYDYDDR